MIELEICANSLKSALAAQEGRATRVELCDNLGEGGTTPSYGQIALAMSKLTIPLFPIIRPRGGDFLYTELEFEIMKTDVLACRSLKCAGVVFGILTDDGKVDIERCTLLKELAGPMAVSFHRAFDMTSDLPEALEALIDIGFVRVLTSGGFPTAIAGSSVLSGLIKQADNRIQIMPGCGIKVENVESLIVATAAKAVHASLSVPVQSEMKYKNKSARMGTLDDEYLSSATSLELVRKMVTILDCLDSSC